MAYTFSSASIEELKNSINIVDVVSQAVPLKRAGSNFKGLCPFHKEKTPSFTVSETRQHYTCFGCGESGDVIEFVKRYYNLEFGEAVEKLANQYGITMEHSSYNDNRKEYYEINKLAARFFYNSFTKKANKGYSYMKNRGITEETMAKFGIGYADESWDSLFVHLTNQGVSKEKMLELGLISESKGKCYDRFRNRVIFPIINNSGNVIGFGGRAIDPGDTPKYLNSPESRVFQKKNNLYGLNVSRQEAGKEGYIILVEGYMDVISLYQKGIKNVAASLGTALTENQAKLIHRYTKDAVLSYDSDAAGRNAALRGLEILKSQNIRVRVLHVTDGKDPDEYVKKYGREAFLNLVNDALPYGDYKLESAKIGLNLDVEEERLMYLNKAIEILKGMSPVEQEVYKQKLSRDIGVSENAIDRELSLTQDAVSSEQSRKPYEETATDAEEIYPLERVLIKLILTDEEYIGKLANVRDVLSTRFANKVLDMAIEAENKDKIIDTNKLIEELQGEEQQILQDIVDNILIDSNHEKVFNECLTSHKLDELGQRERELINRLSMETDPGDDNKTKEIVDQLKNIQLEKDKLHQGNHS